MERAHPTTLVPPIPEKHSISDYATKASKAKEDVNMIEKRKRMLQTFLNRVATHPVLSRFHCFHQFLEGRMVWKDILNGSGLDHLLKIKDETKTHVDKKTLKENGIFNICV